MQSKNTPPLRPLAHPPASPQKVHGCSIGVRPAVWAGRTPATLALLAAVLALGACQTIDAQVGQGTFSFSDDAGADSESDVQVINVTLAKPIDDHQISGVEFELWTTDDDLSSSSLGGGAEFESIEVAPFAEYPNDDGGVFRYPVRVGGAFRRATTSAGGLELEEDSIALKVGVRPEVDLVRGKKGALTLGAGLWYSYGVVFADFQGIGSEDDAVTVGTYGVDVMLEYERGSVQVGAGWLLRGYSRGDIELESSAGTVVGVDHDLSALVIALRVGI